MVVVRSEEAQVGRGEVKWVAVDAGEAAAAEVETAAAAAEAGSPMHTRGRSVRRSWWPQGPVQQRRVCGLGSSAQSSLNSYCLNSH